MDWFNVARHKRRVLEGNLVPASNNRFSEKIMVKQEDLRVRLPQLPERIATVAMPAPTSSVPPVRLKMRIARGLRTKLRALAAISA